MSQPHCALYASIHIWVSQKPMLSVPHPESFLVCFPCTTGAHLEVFQQPRPRFHSTCRRAKTSHWIPSDSFNLWQKMIRSDGSTSDRKCSQFVSIFDIIVIYLFFSLVKQPHPRIDFPCFQWCFQMLTLVAVLRISKMLLWTCSIC